MGTKEIKQAFDDESRCKTESDAKESDEEKEIEDLFQAELDEANEKAEKKKKAKQSKKKKKRKNKKDLFKSQIIPDQEKRTLKTSKSDISLIKKKESKKSSDIPKPDININDYDINALDNNMMPSSDDNQKNDSNNKESPVFDINSGISFVPPCKSTIQPKLSDNPDIRINQENRSIPHEVYSQVNQKDLHTINVCMKKCSERFNQGLTAFKENNYIKSYELFSKAKHSYNQLLIIITNKEKELPKQFVQTLRIKIKEKIDKIDSLNKTVFPLAHQQKYSLQKHFDNFITKNSNHNVVVKQQGQNQLRPSKIETNQKNEQKKKSIHDKEDEEMDAKIESEIMSSNPGVKFSDIVGMKDLKQIIYEIIIMPAVRPDLFTGLRRPQRGLLLFGPPGTGKTMIAKAVASECKSTFFNISAASLTSKWVGESEKTVRSLFKLAYKKQPSIIFIDEIDSILSKRSDNDNEAAKRLKTEFLIQFDGLGSNADARLLVITATNRPMDLDDALLRRLPKRVYCGPLDEEGRADFILKLIKTIDINIKDEEIKDIAKKTDGYSNSDLKELCREAAYEPIRELSTEQIKTIQKFRPITKKDFDKALKKIRGTISSGCVKELMEWNKQFGAMA